MAALMYESQPWIASWPPDSPESTTVVFYRGFALKAVHRISTICSCPPIDHDDSSGLILEKALEEF
jgi:hypothetical protein